MVSLLAWASGTAMAGARFVASGFRHMATGYSTAATTAASSGSKQGAAGQGPVPATALSHRQNQWLQGVTDGCSSTSMQIAHLRAERQHPGITRLMLMGRYGDANHPAQPMVNQRQQQTANRLPNPPSM